MKRKKEAHIHRPSTHDIFLCLQCFPEWAKLLLSNGKIYEPFLSKLVEKNFFYEDEEKVTVKRIAESFKYKKERITKWLADIYDDIFQLNFAQPHLFKEEGIKHDLYLKGYHGSASLTLWLKSTPRLYEQMDIYFVKAKLGTDIFWVSNVQHTIGDSEHSITVWLQDGFCNKYRELLVDRAQYFGYLGLLDVLQKKNFEIDQELKKVYKY